MTIWVIHLAILSFCLLDNSLNIEKQGIRYHLLKFFVPGLQLVCHCFLHEMQFVTSWLSDEHLNTPRESVYYNYPNA